MTSVYVCQTDAMLFFAFIGKGWRHDVDLSSCGKLTMSHTNGAHVEENWLNNRMFLCKNDEITY
jgi:hypothetical protein